MSEEISIAWECVHCKRRWLWKWQDWDAIEGEIHMTCEFGCKQDTKGRLVWIGDKSMALAR
jgi:hypothetical protein